MVPASRTTTATSPAWRSPRRVLGWTALFSMAIHVPFFTSEWTRAFFGAMAGSKFELVDLDGSAELPLEVELLDDKKTSLARSSGDDAVANDPSGEAAAAQAKALQDRNALDAGVDASAADASVDGGALAVDGGVDAGALSVDAGRDATVSTPLAGLDAGTDASVDGGAAGGKSDGDAGLGVHDAGVTDGGAAPVREVSDPVSMVGNTSSITGGSPNVSLLFNMDVVRANSPTLATQIGPAISNIKQWNAFFGATTLDPVRDTDRILIAGPQMKKTDDIVAVVQIKGDAKRAKAAVDLLVKVGGGSWESQTPAIAKVTVDGTERHLLLPGNSIVLIVPNSLLDKAKKIASPTFPKPNGEALVVKLKDPSKALKGLPFTIPSTVQWLRISLVIRSDGSGEVLFKADEVDPPTATQTAKTLSDGIESIRVRKMLGLSVTLFGPVTFRTSGATVIGTGTLTPAELRSIGELVPEGLRGLGGNKP